MINRKNVLMTIDTEACGLADPVYDIGWQIHDKAGNVISQYHALVEEIFTDPDRMTQAYFAKKVFTDYAPMLDRQEIRLVPWTEIVEIMRDHVLTHDVNIISAYNLGFDQRAIKITHRLLNGEDAIIPKPVKILDLWQFACEVLMSRPSFKKLAKELEWTTEKGNFKTSAEIAYRFITGEYDFIEDHTALSDAKIETAIAARCYATKKRVPYGVINAQPWMIPNEITRKDFYSKQLFLTSEIA